MNINSLTKPKWTAPPGPVPVRAVGVLRQDPSVRGAHREVVQLQLELQGDRLQSKDFELTVPVPANEQGQYVFDVKDVDHFLPASILGTLQSNFDLFTSYCDQMPPLWSSGEPRLPIYPDWDLGFNCFYSNGHSADMHRPGLYFCHGHDPLTQQDVYAGLSSELVTHEQGHAILDRFRPHYFDPGFWSLEGAAFHEAFGDVFCLLLSLKDPATLARVIEQTAGDLSIHNVVSDIGEQFGSGINHKSQAKDGKPDLTGGAWLRTAINDLVWVDPASLPETPAPGSGPNEFGSEAHSFSQLWTGASYEILHQMTRQLMDQGMPAASALQQADEDMLKLYGKLVSNTAPKQKFSYQDVARSLLEADRLLGGKWSGLLEQVMTKRKILAGPSQPGDLKGPLLTLASRGANSSAA